MSDKITQDNKFLQQIFGHLTSNQLAGMNVVVFGGGVTVNNEARKFDFDDFLMALPEPRLESLKNMAIKVALEHCKTQLDAASFLGIAERTIRRTGKEVKELVLLEGGKDMGADDG